MHDNPYRSPRESDPARRPPGLTDLVAPKAILFVLASAAACGAAGLLIGAALRAFLPSYYRSVFVGGDRPRPKFLR